jgi:hypothetical protein
MTPQQRAEYDGLRAENMDRKSQFYTAELKGRTEGLALVAKNMKLDGMPVEKISKFTGLTTYEIENL